MLTAKADESKPSGQKPEEPATSKASEGPSSAQDKDEAKESARGPPKKTEGLQVKPSNSPAPANMQEIIQHNIDKSYPQVRVSVKKKTVQKSKRLWLL